ncbi:hypothetical protein NUW58_g2232 [Xylaria curta]|uniref:Uncharacterized protein n=1 Tax=Xylaria curta TaxID=42375 RepID=A0ACC1PHX3_9PEZI|nr:hypothetical protein NUW58_g2232 [Xylaria curta]
MTTNGTIYFLNAGSAQSEDERLNTQFYLFNDAVRNELLPQHISSSLSASSAPPKIMEIATGTGIWLSELAKTLPPDAELVGLDYDTSKFPPTSSLTPNITLRHADMYEPFPSDLLGKFDVVHVRLVIFAMKDGYGARLAKNLMTLLKPGGHITCLPIGMIAYLQEAGFVDCDDRAYPASAQLYTQKRKDWNKRMNSQLRTLVAQTLTGIINLGGVDGMTTKEEADELMTLCNEEFVDRKVHMVFTRAWGRKPEVS